MNDLARQAGQFADVNAVAAVGAAGLDLAQKQNPVLDLLDGNRVVPDAGAMVGQFGKLMVMRGKKALGRKILRGSGIHTLTRQC